MMELLGDWKRTATCGELRASHAGRSETLMGWVKSVRDLGGVIFVGLRDRYGVTQVVFRPELAAPKLMEKAKRIGLEYVIAVRGKVQERPQDARNPEMATGEIEILPAELKILNEATPPPFLPSEETTANEELRLRYRYLDLRRESLQAVLALRHGVYQSVRKCLSKEGFLEIETPLLVRPTPEGARDFLVPSRVHRGKFFALPQSPQLYKQLLMVSGFDRYFQLAKCLRDEDPRADRQPEFAQIDLEMSFGSEEDIFGIMERMFVSTFEENMGVKLETPFPRFSYEEAMHRFGSDKPDLRVPFEIVEVSEAARSSGFPPIAEAARAGDRVACIVAPFQLSRREVSDLESLTAQTDVKPLFWARVAGRALEGGIAKSISEGFANKILEGAPDTGVVLVAVGRRALQALGAVRVALGNRVDSARSDFRFAWVRDFPVFTWNEEESRWEPSHHMFSMPYEECIDFLETDPGKVRGHVYDLVCNGVELGSGSTRIHSAELQLRVMKVVGLTPDEAQKRFGFLLEALRLGAPPHGGIALGIDRLIMLMSGRQAIRDAIAFPKTTSATSLMDGAPCEVDAKEIADLGIKLV
jgi:aspartyl-tRNA synthetase